MFDLPEIQLQVFHYLQLFPDFFVVREVCHSWRHMIDQALGLRRFGLYPLKLTTIDLVELLHYVEHEHGSPYCQIYPQLRSTNIDDVIHAMCENRGMLSHDSTWKETNLPSHGNLINRLLWRHQRWIERLVGCNLVRGFNSQDLWTCSSLKQVIVTANFSVCRFYERKLNRIAPHLEIIALDKDTLVEQMTTMDVTTIIKNGMTVDGVSVRPLMLTLLTHNRVTPSLLPLLNQMNMWLSVSLNTSCTIPPQQVAWTMLQNDHQQGTDMPPLIIRYVKRFHQYQAHSSMQCGSSFDFLGRCLGVGWIRKEQLSVLYLDLGWGFGFGIHKPSSTLFY